MSTITTGFAKYDEATNDIWEYKILASYSKINYKLAHTHKKSLSTPIIKLNDQIHSKWGSWNPTTRTITLSLELLRNYEWGAVEYVLKHEMAHQIVSEVFNMDCYGVAHGEAWARACGMVGIEPVRCSSKDFLASFKSSSNSKIVDKIHKILIHANDGGATEEEADTFMVKARELMIKHNLKMQDITGESQVWVKRPFGLNFKRFPSWMSSMASLLKDHYHVKCVITYAMVKGVNVKRLELFGEPSNLDIAEYVGHALLAQGDYLYEQFKNDENREAIRWGKISKASFLDGLFEGYADKLSKNYKQAVEKIKATDGTIVPAFDDRLLSEMFNKGYSNLRSSSRMASRGGGRTAGRDAGSNLTLAKGVSSKQRTGRLQLA